MSGLEAHLRVAHPGFELDARLAAPAHGVTSLFGASGSGKTTVLRCIAGLVRGPGSFVAFGGDPWQDDSRFVPAHKRGCAYVFQEASLFAHLSVRRNLEYGAQRRAQSARQADFSHTVEMLGIGTLLDRSPASLSGGERQRVAIARALLASPRLLLMDEPLASLDAPRKAEILYYIERLRDELRIPIVYVSHALDEVVRLADHVVLLSEGKVLGAGSVSEIAGRIDLRPYLGRYEGGAVLEARVGAQDLETGLAHLEFAGGALLVPDVEALVGERVRVRIRARDVSVATEKPQSISILNVLPGTISEVGAADGSGVDVRVDVGGSPILARITRHSANRLALAPGKPVYALIKAVSLDRRSVGYA